MPRRDMVAHANHVMERPSTGDRRKLRRYLVAAVGAAVGLFEPLLNAVVAKDMLAPRQAQRSFDNALWASLAEVVVADDACYRDGLALKVVDYMDGVRVAYFAPSRGGFPESRSATRRGPF